MSAAEARTSWRAARGRKVGGIPTCTLIILFIDPDEIDGNRAPLRVHTRVPLKSLTDLPTFQRGLAARARARARLARLDRTVDFPSPITILDVRFQFDSIRRRNLPSYRPPPVKIGFDLFVLGSCSSPPHPPSSRLVCVIRFTRAGRARPTLSRSPRYITHDKSFTSKFVRISCAHAADEIFIGRHGRRND